MSRLAEEAIARMTKKHFEALARIIAKHTFPALSSQPNQETQVIKREPFMDDLTNYLLGMNRNFNWRKFMIASQPDPAIRDTYTESWEKHYF